MVTSNTTASYVDSSCPANIHINSCTILPAQNLPITLLKQLSLHILASLSGPHQAVY
jgi:hypothetical protein